MKKLMVTQIKQRVKNAITLAIGDGANDVDMIMGAHVGVGIAGVEGSAASNSADYAVGTFRMLHTLVFVHGFWNYDRFSNLVYIIFFKALLLAFASFFYGFFSSFSGQQYFDEWSQVPYNVMYTALPIIALSVFDKPLSKWTLQNHPVLYASHRGRAFTLWRFLGWVLRAFLHAAIAFFIPIFGMTGDRARTNDIFWTSTVVLYAIVLIPTQIIMFNMATMNFLHLCALLSSYVSVIAVTFILSDLPTFDAPFYMTVMKLWVDAEAWLSLILACALPLLLELAYRSFMVAFHPTPMQVMKERERFRKRPVPLQQKRMPSIRDSTVVHLLAEEKKKGPQSKAPLVREESRPGQDPEQLQKMIVRSMLRFRGLAGAQLESSHDRFQKHDAPTKGKTPQTPQSSHSSTEHKQ